MTMAELDFVWYGYRHKEEQEWVKTRWQTTILVNMQLPKGKKVKPTELLELDCDKRNRNKNVKIMSNEELQEVLKKYENIKPI
jgi:hypothetical protein